MPINEQEYEPAWEYDDREEVWCEECQGLGEIECDCGGDLCVCLNYGTRDCPKCGGLGHTLEEPRDRPNSALLALPPEQVQS